MNAALKVALIVALIAVLSLSGSAVAQTGLGGIGQFSMRVIA